MTGVTCSRPVFAPVVCNRSSGPPKLATAPALARNSSITLVFQSLGMIAPSGGGALAAHLEMVEQVLGGGGDRSDGVLERRYVVAGRGAEPAHLADVLERGGPHIGIGDVLGVRLAEGFDTAAHETDPTRHTSPD